MLFDLHCDTIMRICDDDSKLSRNDYHIDIEKMKKGGSKVQFFAMFVDMSEVDNPYHKCNSMIDRFYEEMGLNKESIQQGLKASDIGHKMTGVITIEEGGVLLGEMKNLHHFYDRGVRSITLTWNYENELGYPNCQEAFRQKGLKPFGIEVVKEMSKLGMLVDVSHLSDAGFWDCITYAEGPIIASHSNARTVCDHSRNLTDDMIIALRDKGGVMGMNFCSAFLDGSHLSKISSIVDHINYIHDLAGPDVIAIGSDFDGIGGELELSDMSKMPLLRQALKEAGYSEDTIDKFFYKNALRVFQNVH